MRYWRTTVWTWLLSALVAVSAYAGDIGLLGIESRDDVRAATEFFGVAYGTAGDRFIVYVEDGIADEITRADLDLEIVLREASPQEVYLVLAPPGQSQRQQIDIAMMGDGADLEDGTRLVLMSQSSASLVATTSDYKTIPLTDLATDFHYRPPVVAAPSAAPQAYPADTLALQVSLDSIYAFDQRLEDFYTRYVWTDSIDRARDWLVQKFEDWGYTDVTTPTFSWGGGTHYNVMAVKPGVTEPENVIVVGAHYDSYLSGDPGPMVYAPGADDDGSGTTAVLELARILADVPLRKTVIFIPFSAEEVGLVGSRAAAQSFKAAGTDVEVMFNMDMIGYTGGQPFKLKVQTNNELYRQVTVSAGIRNSSANPILADLTGSSDHMSFKNEGFNIVYLQEDNFNFPGWHTVQDLTVNMDFPYLTEVVKTALTSVAIIAESPSPTTAEEIVDRGDGQSLEVVWTDCHADNAYTIYKGDETGLYTDSITVSPGVCSYVWNGLTEGQEYFFLVIGTSPVGYRGLYGVEGSEIPYTVPRPPTSPVAVADSAKIHINWSNNKEADLSHYNLYRRAQQTPSFQLVADHLTVLSYTDEDVFAQSLYEYYVTAVDFDSYESEPSPIVSSYAATFDGGLVIADAFSMENQYIPLQAEQEAWMDSVMDGTPFGIAVVEEENDSLTRSSVGPYSSLFWLDDDLVRKTIGNSNSILDWYAGFNTNMAVTGFMTVIDWSQDQRPIPTSHMLYTEFGLTNYSYWGYSDFVGAFGQNGWPSVEIDPERGIDQWTNIAVFESRPGAEVIYTFDSFVDWHEFEGLPCGIIYDTPRGKRVLLGFPVYNLTLESSRALMAKIVEYFGVEFVAWSPGDLNGDMLVDIADLTRLIAYMYLNAPPPQQINPMDVDGNCVFDIGDLTRLIGYLYLEGPDPAPGCLE